MKTMKTWLVTIAVLLCSTTVSAYDFEVDGIYYNIIPETYLTIEVAYSSSYTGEIIIPGSVTYNGYTYSVTSIGECAFRECENLTSVTIPNSVTKIKNLAFSGCQNLTMITIPNSVTIIEMMAFSGCRKLKTITLPNFVTYIGDGAFEACGLTSISIPNSITNIGFNVFCGCSYLTDIFIPTSVTSIEQGAFESCHSLPIENNIRYADTWAIEITDPSQTSYNLRYNTTGLANYLFFDCSNLTNICIPNSTVYIGWCTFADCN